MRAGHGPPKGGHYVLILLVALFARTSEAAIGDYIGKTVVEVRLQSNGAELRDPALLEIIETRTGSPLVMVQVRESMAHLFGLGLYQDVQVDASLREQGVVLTYNLVPAQRFRRIGFEGPLGVSESELRRIVLEAAAAGMVARRQGGL